MWGHSWVGEVTGVGEIGHSSSFLALPLLAPPSYGLIDLHLNLLSSRPLPTLVTSSQDPSPTPTM